MESLDTTAGHAPGCRSKSVSRNPAPDGQVKAWCAACDREWIEAPEPSAAERMMAKGLRRA